MLRPHLPPRRFAALGLAFAAASCGYAQLAANSPFMPPAAAAAAAGAPAGGTIEYLGYMQTGQGRLFRLYDPARKARVWAKLNEPNAELGVVVKKHDADKGTLTLEHHGKVLTLEEPKAKVAAGAAPALPPPPPVPSNVPAAVTQAVVLNPTPADEARRLDAVAAEVQRRRALRDQAAQQVNQGVTAPVGAPPAMGPAQVPPGMPRAALPPNAVGAQPR